MLAAAAILLPLLLLAAQLPGACPAIDVWFGSAPFCKSNANSCHLYDLTYIRSDSRGTGTKCTRGEKVLCQSKPLLADLKDTPTNDLVVVTYNLFEVPFSNTHNGQAERTCHVPRALLNKIPEVDVIIFSELLLGGCLQSGQADRTVSLMDLMTSYGFLHSTKIVGESDRAFYNVNGGTMIVSRWPIVQSSEYIFSNYAGSDRFSEKGAMYAKLSKQGVIYHIVGTHMQASAEHEQVRIDQAKELHQFIADMDLPRREPVIIAGDFNCDRLGNAGHTVSVLSAMHAALPTVIGARTSTYDYSSNEMVDPSHMVKEWLDYVAYSKLHMQPDRASLEAIELKSDTRVKFCSRAIMQPYYVSPEASLCGKVTVTRDLSDHFPVVGRFTFNFAAI